MKITKNKKVYEENINDIPARAMAIIFPDNIQEIKTFVKSSSIDVVPRASGTSFVGGDVCQDSIVLDLSKMHNLLELDVGRKIAVVEPGIIIDELNDILEEYNLEFPILSLFSGVETIGSMIAKNASSSRELKYGKIMNWLDSAELITDKGEQVRISKADLSEVIGMEGTTGIIIKANIRLTAKKPRTMTILKSDNLGFIIKTNKQLRLDQDISAIDLIDRNIARLFGLENKYHLFVEYESEKGFFKKKDYTKFFKMKNQAYSKAAGEGYYILDCFKIFSENLEDFLGFLEENNIPFFGHISTGVIYCCFKKDDKNREEVIKLAKKFRAAVSYGLGFGLKNKQYLSEDEKKLIKRVQARRAPLYKINKNKLIDYDFDIDLKVEEEVAEQVEEEIEKREEQEKLEELDKEQEIADNISEMQEKRQEQTTLNPETITLKKEELSEEEKEKVKKIAFGFFGGKKDGQKY